MACFNLEKKDTSRYQIQYPTSNPDPKTLGVRSDTPLQASYQLVLLQNTDQGSFTFEKKFDGTPTVVAGFVSLSSLLQNPGANVYVESVTPEGGVVKTTGPVVVGAVAVHAIYMGS